MQMKFTHITLLVNNLDDSINFYTDVCGLAVVKDLRKDKGISVWLGRESIEISQPNFVIVLIEQEVVSAYDHLGFQFESKEAFDNSAIKHKKLIIEGPEYLGEFLGYYYLINDPNGHIVEFTFGQYIKGF